MGVRPMPDESYFATSMVGQPVSSEPTDQVDDEGFVRLVPTKANDPAKPNNSLYDLSGQPACAEIANQLNSDGFIQLKRRGLDDPPQHSEMKSALVGQPVGLETADQLDESGFFKLKPTEPNDPIRLEHEIGRRLSHRFKERKQKLYEGQFEALQEVIAGVLNAVPNTVAAIPLVPGGGKSTAIEAMSELFAERFAAGDPIAQRVGGVVIVVESSLEAHQLADICTEAGGDNVVAVVEGVNDSNLREYGCPIGLAETIKDSPRRTCENFANCKLAQAAYRLQETPILIMLHARYQRYLEDMAPLSIWYDADGVEHHRSLLLVDELPNLFDVRELSFESFRKAEEELDRLLVPRNLKDREEKRYLITQWEWLVRIPFTKLMKIFEAIPHSYGLVTQDQFAAAGFDKESLKRYREALALRFTDCAAIKIIDTIMGGSKGFFSNDKSFAVTVPRLMSFDKSSGFATVVFSGTAQLAPELVASGAEVLDCPLEESYDHLQIIVQHSGEISATRTGLDSSSNVAATTAWVKEILTQEIQGKALLATYKSAATTFYKALSSVQDRIFPYTDRNHTTYPKLPYFGGLAGSNVYNTATSVICIGLNRFQPHEYLARYLALNPNEDALMDELDAGVTKLTAASPVMDLQDIYLAADIIQLVFRSALRNHGAPKPVQLYLFQPPKGVIAAIRDYFGDCRIEEIPELSETCLTAASTARTYGGVQTKVARLEHFLKEEWDGIKITPEEIRNKVGLTKSQYKEARKSAKIGDFFDRHVTTCGSGSNTYYLKNLAMNG